MATFGLPDLDDPRRRELPPALQQALETARQRLLQPSGGAFSAPAAPMPQLTAPGAPVPQEPPAPRFLPPQAAVPSLTPVQPAPSASAARFSPSQPAVPTLQTAQPATALPLTAAPTPERQELTRLTTGPTGKSGIAQIHSRAARIPLQILDAIGTAVLPQLTMGIPGTEMHHQFLVHGARANVKEQETEQTAEATRKHLGAETEAEQALAKSRLNPAEKEPTSPFALWHQQNPKGTIQQWQALSAKEGKPDIHVQYAEAVADAMQRGVKPDDDPKVQQLSDAITGLQRTPAPKEPARDDKAIAIYAKPPEKRTPEEIAYLKGYEKYVNETKVQPGVVRMQVLGETRGVPMLDTKNQNTPTLLNWEQINAANKSEPGRYIPAGTSGPALTKTALMEDIRGNVQQVRDSLQAMPNFDTMDKAKIAVALRSRDPRGAMSALISGAAAGSLSPQQQEYLIRVTNLIENAMAMRSVLGAGQGSEDLRSAITATIPGPTTPSKDYALRQLETFEKVLDRLERGVPKVPLRTDLGGGAQGGAVPTVSTKAEYDKLPAGAAYLKDGVQYRKR